MPTVTSGLVAAGLRSTMARRLATFERQAAPDDHGLRHAAVAIVVVDGDDDDDGEPAFLLTRRASKLRAHPGQWALPGGRWDDGEDAIAAARRELHEELGLDLGVATVLGTLDDYLTRSGYAITPVVMWAPPHIELRPDPAEVAAVYRVPLRELERPDSPRFVTIAESDRPVVQVAIFEHLIHAPTAAVLYQFGEVALAGRHTRVADLEQPVWAWG